MRQMRQASEYIRQNLQNYLRSFLLTHLNPLSSNTHLAKRSSQLGTIATSQSDFQPYFEWVRGPAAVSVGGHHMFALLTGMIG